MSSQLARRLKRIETRLKPEQGWVVFQVRYAHKEEDFQRQYAEYIANGGDPDVFFIVIQNYGNFQEPIAEIASNS
jgi:hypothetical protein